MKLIDAARYGEVVADRLDGRQSRQSPMTTASLQSTSSPSSSSCPPDRKTGSGSIRVRARPDGRKLREWGADFDFIDDAIDVSSQSENEGGDRRSLWHSGRRRSMFLIFLTTHFFEVCVKAWRIFVLYNHTMKLCVIGRTYQRHCNCHLL